MVKTLSLLIVSVSLAFSNSATSNTNNIDMHGKNGRKYGSFNFNHDKNITKIDTQADKLFNYKKK